MDTIKNTINIDDEILFGQPVFRGTRVPISSLFMHLEKGISLDDFLFDFPSVSREKAISVLEIAGKIVNSKNIEQLYETAS